MRAFGCFAAEHLTRHEGLNIGGRQENTDSRWVWVVSVHDSQNIFANVDGQRAFDANKCD